MAPPEGLSLMSIDSNKLVESEVDESWTVPMICALRGELDKMPKLAAHDPLLTNSKGETVFIIAAKHGHID